MHKPAISSLVYKYLFPRARPNEPNSFSAHITRNLVPEVRIETANFYGALDCIEAQYPGLDYCYAPHRRRLSRFPWHRKLFRAFDDLGLTRDEILALCQWEGTKSAKDKYERDAGRPIRDTTMDGIMAAELRSEPVAYFSEARDWEAEAQRTMAEHGLVEDGYLETRDEQIDHDVENPDVVRASYGVQLNEQLRAAVNARARGETVPLDEQWEQWLKEAMERDELGVDVMLNAIREGRPIHTSQSPTMDAATNPVSMDIATSTFEPDAIDLTVDSPPRRQSQILNNTQTAMMHLYDFERVASPTAAVAATAAINPPTGEAR